MEKNPDVPSITLVDGTVVTADLVIAADGVHSTAVEAILGKTNPPEVAKHANCCYRFLIPRTDLEADPETSFFNRGHQQLGVRLFIDPNSRRRLISYTCRKYVVRSQSFLIHCVSIQHLMLVASHEIHNFVAICYNDDVISKREGEQTWGF